MNRRERRARDSQKYFKAYYYQQISNLRRAKRNLSDAFKRRAFDFLTHVQY